MAQYSIRDLEKLCGIKAHTIRVWEQRYGIVQPKRTKTNIRYYQDEDLRQLLNIAVLNRNGLKISKIAKMTAEEIQSRVEALSENPSEPDTQMDALTISMIEMDEPKFDRIISKNIKKIGFERTMLEVIYPFLDKLSLLWLTGSVHPVQEHFMSYLIRQKIISAIDREPLINSRKAKKFLIYLPEGETQELSLLFLHYVLKSRGNKVINIGQNITLEDLKDAYSIQKPDFIYTMITETYTKKPVQKYTYQLSESFPKCTILLSGYQIIAQDVQSENNIQVLNSLDDTLSFLKSTKVLNGG